MNQFYLNELTESHTFDDFTCINLSNDQDCQNLNITEINKRNSEGWTKLMYACYNGHRKTVEYLINNGSTLSHQGDQIPTPLMLAVESGDLTIVKAVTCLRDLEVVDNRGWTALFYAVFFGRELCAEYLLIQGANVLTIDKNGDTPITKAISLGMDSMVSLLLRAPVNRTLLNSPKPLSPVPSVSKTPLQTKRNLDQSKQVQYSTTPTRKLKLFGQKRTYTLHTPSKEAQKENMSPKNQNIGSPAIPPRSPFLQLKNGQQLTPTSPKPSNLFPQKLPDISVLPPRELKNHSVAQDNEPTVQNFLANLGLEKYWPIFRDEEVDFETFLTFHEQNLVEIGIDKYGPRRKIVMAIRQHLMNSTRPHLFNKTFL